MAKNIETKLKKALAIGTFLLAGGVYSGGKLEVMTKPNENYHGKLTNYLEKQADLYNSMELEKRLAKEQEFLSKPLLIDPDMLNTYIKDAYSEVNVWPKEFDKRLFRLLIRQESGYDAHAVSSTGYMGLGQIGFDVYKSFKPEKWESFKDPATGQIDTLAVKKDIFNPVTNIGLSLRYLDFLSDFCRNHDPDWKNLDLDEKRRTILTCYNAGHGKVQKLNWDLESEKLKKEQREYANKIMNVYNGKNIKVKT